MSETFSHRVQVYYEDTDLSGSVYHANYLKFCERAREHAIGADVLADLHEEGLGFVVYGAELDYRQSAGLGDRLEVESTARRESDYRVVFEQVVRRVDDGETVVDATIELVCVDDDQELVPLPGVVPV
ncbi:MAG: acyl-CoA thioesterase [Bradymonadaceae bacterium]